MAPDRRRCAWPGTDPLYVAYHDEEWGVPVRDDAELLEKLCLDGFQAGLSWIIVLRKRESIRAAFDRFDPERVAAYGESDVARLLADPGIIRNRQKVRAAIENARAFLRLRDAGRSFSDVLWAEAGGMMTVNRFRTLADLPAETPASKAMSKTLAALGFRFCGPTICYAFMQAVGMVNDHTLDCFRHDEVSRLGGRVVGKTLESPLVPTEILR